MAAYHWDPAAIGDVFVLPAAVVDAALKLASPAQLQTLLWFSRHHQQWDAAACAATIGGTPAECESHLQFWLQQGLLQTADPAVLPAAPTAKAPRPAAVKPQLAEVLAYQEKHREFAIFVEEVSARLGKPLSHGDVATLLYLTTTAGLPQAAVLLIVGYAVSVGKSNLRYIEVTALNWADEDITTPEEVDRRIQELGRQRDAAAHVERTLGLTRPLTATQAKLADKWIHEWGFSDAMLQQAHAETLEKAGKAAPAYTDKILENWYTAGIRRPEDIPQAPARKKGVDTTNPEHTSLDVEGFEEQLLQYRPKYNPKKNT